METVAAVYAETVRDPALDTPRKQAVEIGQNLRSDRVLLGAVWRFREKGAGKYHSVRSNKWVLTL